MHFTLTSEDGSPLVPFLAFCSFWYTIEESYNTFGGPTKQEVMGSFIWRKVEHFLWDPNEKNEDGNMQMSFSLRFFFFWENYLYVCCNSKWEKLVTQLYFTSWNCRVVGHEEWQVRLGPGNARSISGPSPFSDLI